MTGLPPPFPDRLRRRTPRRRIPRWPLALAVALATAAAMPLWEVRSVDLEACQELPSSVRESLAGLVGSSQLLLDLDWVRSMVEACPQVAGVDVQLELPGTLRVAVRPAASLGSFRVGTGWHGVTTEGCPAGPLAAPLEPRLEGFSSSELPLALSVVRRLEQATGATVAELRHVLPDDLEATLRRPGDDAEVRVHVGPDPTPAEHFWCAAMASGRAPSWADVRCFNRLVVTEGGDG
jgi:hypothetical protein